MTIKATLRLLALMFAWFRAHDGHLASLFGAAARLYVYDAEPPPAPARPAARR